MFLFHFLEMFKSTDIRHRAKTDFLTSYEHNCALRNSLPVKYVLSGIGGDTLIADVSKIRSADWAPLLQEGSKSIKVQP